jgi:F0F1-type ATP synthase membrane subunit b/b'
MNGDGSNYALKQAHEELGRLMDMGAEAAYDRLAARSRVKSDPIVRDAVADLEQGLQNPLAAPEEAATQIKTQAEAQAEAQRQLALVTSLPPIGLAAAQQAASYWQSAAGISADQAAKDLSAAVAAMVSASIIKPSDGLKITSI